MAKILVINPLVNDPWIEADRTFLSEHKQKGTNVDVVSIEYGPTTGVGSGLARLIDDLFVIEKIMWAEKQGYDAVIVNCFGDPGVRVARHVVRIPVIGPGEATLHVASMLGRRISILSPGDPSICTKPSKPRIFDGLIFEIASVRRIGPMADITKDFEKTYSITLEKAKKCIEEDDAHVIVFGCTVMSTDRLAEKLQKDIGIPVLDASSTALAVAELLVHKNLSQSPKAYPRSKDTNIVLPKEFNMAIKEIYKKLTSAQ